MNKKPLLPTPVMNREASAKIYGVLQGTTPPTPKKLALLRRAVRVYQNANGQHQSTMTGVR